MTARLRRLWSKFRKPASPRAARWRIFVSAALLCAFCGLVQLGLPVEELIKGGRDYIRRHPASGQIVVVGLDDKTAAELGGFTFSRQYDARLVERLFALGARRVFFDRVYADRMDPKQDRMFAEALARHRGRVFLGATSITVNGRKVQDLLPSPEFRKAAPYRSLFGAMTPFSISAWLRLNDEIGGTIVPSMSAEIAGKGGKGVNYFRPDWSIDFSTIRTLSFVDVVANRVPAREIRGKDIIVGPTAFSLNDIKWTFLQGNNPGVFFHVIGAETLLRGDPLALGWAPLLGISLVLGGLHLTTRRRGVRTGVAVAASAILVLLPFYLDAHLIAVDIVPSTLFLLIVGYRGAALRRVQSAAQIHARSGLPDIVVLEDEAETPETIIAARVGNYAQIVSAFPFDIDRDLFGELARRLNVSGAPGRIFHAEDALVWASAQPAGTELAQHLEGLHTIAARPIRIGTRDVDIRLAFGFDGDRSRPLRSRIGSALLSAEEASGANQIWRASSHSHLEDTSWRLSLMSRMDEAMANGELWVAFQPKVDLRNGRVIGAEALLRWTHPTIGPISPEIIVAEAEAHNRISQLSRFVLEKAARASTALTAAGHDIGLAVNISPALLFDSGLEDDLARLDTLYALAPETLTLEIVETGNARFTRAQLDCLKRLAKAGYRLSVDDYGTGSATLDYIRTIPSKEVKIDKRFIQNLEQDRDNLVLVRSTVEMAHQLGRVVVAEGVETWTAFDLITNAGCDVAQGYLFGRPMRLEALIAKLNEETAPPKRLAYW